MTGRHTLLDMAKLLPKGHPMVKQVLKNWIEDRIVRENSEIPSIEYVRAAIKITEMKYKVGFLEKEEALLELFQEGKVLNSETSKTAEEYEKFLQLLLSVENDTFEFSYKRP